MAIPRERLLCGLEADDPGGSDLCLCSSDLRLEKDPVTIGQGLDLGNADAVGGLVERLSGKGRASSAASRLGMVLALPHSFPVYEAGQLARQVALEPVQRTRRTCRGHDAIVLPGHASGRPARRSRCPTRDVATQLVLLTTT
jgi:hypothetical protein